MAVRTRVPPRKAAVRKTARPAARRARKLPGNPATATRSTQTPKQIELTGTTPLPVRITAEQQAMLVKKRDKTGVPIQELVRRAIDHMLATTDIGAVPARR